MLMWKTRLAVVSILVALPVAGFVVGAYIGDATCDPEATFLGELDCIDHVVGRGVLGFIVGLIIGVLLVLGLRGRRRDS